MAGIYNVPNCDFDYVFSILKSLRKTSSINSLDSEIVIVTNKEFIVRNINKINEHLNKKLFLVFCPEISLKDFNITYNLSNDCLVKSNLARLYRNKSNLDTLIYKPKNLSKVLLKKSKCSVIKDIMTVLYKIQNKSSRELYRNLIFNYLNSNTIDIGNLKNSIILLSKKKSSTLKELLEIIESNIFTDTHNAVLEMKKGNTQKSKISSFDINYILSFKK